MELVDALADDGGLRNLFQIVDHLRRVGMKIDACQVFIAAATGYVRVLRSKRNRRKCRSESLLS